MTFLFIFVNLGIGNGAVASMTARKRHGLVSKSSCADVCSEIQIKGKLKIKSSLNRKRILSACSHVRPSGGWLDVYDDGNCLCATALGGSAGISVGESACVLGVCEEL